VTRRLPAVCGTQYDDQSGFQSDTFPSSPDQGSPPQTRIPQAMQIAINEFNETMLVVNIYTLDNTTKKKRGDGLRVLSQTDVTCVPCCPPPNRRRPQRDQTIANRDTPLTRYLFSGPQERVSTNPAKAFYVREARCRGTPAPRHDAYSNFTQPCIYGTVTSGLPWMFTGTPSSSSKPGALKRCSSERSM
jgi:hypothetical protein